MKIYVLGINYYPELVGISVYTTQMCEYLVNSGNDLTIFTGFPYYPEWKISDKYRNKLFYTEKIQGVKLRRSFVYVPKRVTTLNRILHEFSFLLSSFVNILFSSKSDLIIVISPSLGLGLVAYFISKLTKTPFIFHIQDLQPDAAVELGMIKNLKIIKTLYFIEKFIYKNAKLICVISRKMGGKVASKGIEKNKIYFLPNWIETEHMVSHTKNNIFIKNNKLENKFIILYSGNVGLKQGLDVILDVAKRTKNDSKIFYLIIGDGVYKKTLVRNAKELMLDNVLFLPVQSKELFPHILASADIALVPQQKTVTDIVMPSKLLGLLASSTPVIAGANARSELWNIMNDSGCGIVISPENSDQLFNAILDMYNFPDRIKKYGKNSREYAIKNFSKNVILKSFEQEIRRITK
jgi:colanic acid biosynthesis glycosyl transferase WcaI